jgi:elongation factor 1-gamma
MLHLQDPAVKKRASEDLKKGMAVLDAYLKNETFLVGNQVTLADIAVFCTLLLPLKLVIKEQEAKKSFVNLMRWFDLLAHNQAFIDVVGELCIFA